MTTAQTRPKLRSVESIVVPDRRSGRLLILRDTQGVTSKQVSLTPALVPIVGRFTGAKTCAQIAREASEELGSEVTVDEVVSIADDLDQALFLEGPRFRAAMREAIESFARLDVRHASHAGAAYHGDQHKLRAYLDKDCLAHGQSAPAGRLLALVAPHIDPWRGAACYGHAYNALTRALPDDVDTFILLGTSHAYMRQPFALCRKRFATPLGDVLPDLAAIDTLADAADFDVYADQFNHKREHSLEFQAVFLKHVMGERPFTIVPILASLGEAQASGTDPDRGADGESFLRALRSLVEARGGRAVVLAGADLAHVGPRFGDPAPYDETRRAALQDADGTSLDHATAGRAREFWRHVMSDMDERRVCGLAPIYSLLRALPSGLRGQVLRYEQTIDDDDGSIVSHAAVGFYG